MSKGKIKRPYLSVVKERARGGWGASPGNVLWMLDMLEDARALFPILEWDEEANEWCKEYDKANGT